MKKIIPYFFVLLLLGCSGKTPILGVTSGLFKECPSSPNCVSSQSANEKHFIEPIKVEASSIQAKDYLLKVLKEFGSAEIVLIEENYIKAEFTSKIVRYVDDVEFYLSKERSGMIVVHVRSASRLGSSDFGVNRERVEEVRQRIDTLANH